ncbi:isoflavone reductase [Aureobasidium pullulans]|uniref:Isoflavone reductase n=1 Tax=Aureobasidium pullulans TaxID=5580 RepID=A0A4S8VJQ8_AURPU|nr:isoflavone reductase [Aureobasidium pullulans]
MINMKIAVLGATGTTGKYIVDELLASEHAVHLTALVRASSADKPEVQDLKARGVAIQLIDLQGSIEDMIQALEGQEVVIAILPIAATIDQIPLATAAKKAGVKRFIPTMFAPVAPPKGLSTLRDTKEDVLNHIRRLQLPYTIIDVGWWYQLTLPKLPSGRIDKAVSGLAERIPGDGNVLSAFTHNRDVGRYVVRATLDPRTLNKFVFIYSEMLTMNQVYDQLEKLSGETLPRNHISGDELLANLAQLKDVGIRDDNFLQKAVYEYQYSWGVRGDNNIHNAEYLGYMLGKNLYPDLKGTSMDEYIQELLDESS